MKSVVDAAASVAAVAVSAAAAVHLPGAVLDVARVLVVVAVPEALVEVLVAPEDHADKRAH
jgi:hypothetical protein